MKPRERLRTNLDRRDLADASTAEVLLHGLTFGGEAPVRAILTAARHELEALALASDGHEDPTVRALSETMALVGRRIDVALELLHRRGRTS